jgi:hypothetical protein
MLRQFSWWHSAALNDENTGVISVGPHNDYALLFSV